MKGWKKSSQANGNQKKKKKKKERKLQLSRKTILDALRNITPSSNFFEQCIISIILIIPLLQCPPKFSTGIQKLPTLYAHAPIPGLWYLHASVAYSSTFLVAIL